MRKWLVRAAAVVVLAMLASLSWSALALYRSWNRIERVAFDPPEARERLDVVPPSTVPPTLPESQAGDDPDGGSSALTGVSAPPATPPPSSIPAEEEPVLTGERDVEAASDPLTVLIIGDDSRPNTPSSNADVVALFQIGADGSEALLVSLPRDLQIVHPCSGVETKLATTLEGCGATANGPEAIALAVEGLVEVAIDHVVLLRLDGFRSLVDALGGMEICVEHDVRFWNEGEAHLPAGCSSADGPTAEWWLRARAPQELIDGEWRPIQPAGDQARNRRQLELLVGLMTRLSEFSSIGDLQELVDALADSFVLDDGLTLPGAVGLAWDLRGLDPAVIQRPVIPATPSVSADGNYVVVLDAPIDHLFLGGR